MSPRAGRARRLLAAAPALALVLLIPVRAPAQTSYVWVAVGNAGWTTDTNWTPTTGPGTTFPSAAGDSATFGSAATAAAAVTLGAPATVGKLGFVGANFAYTITGAGSLTLDNGTAPSELTMDAATGAAQTVNTPMTIGNGLGVTLANNSTFALVVGAANVANTFTLGAGGATFTGSGDFTVAGGTGQKIAGAGNLTLNGNGVVTLGNTTSDFSAGAGFTGKAVLNGGVLSLASAGALPNSGALVADSVTLAGGTLRTTAALTLGTNRGVQIGAASGLDIRANTTFNGPLAGSAGLTKTGGGTLTLASATANTFSGTLTVGGGTFLSAATGSEAAVTATLANVAAVTVNHNARLSLNSNTTNQDRLNDAAPVTLNGGRLAYVAAGNLAHAETVGALRVNGFGVLFGTPSGSAGATTAFSAGPLTRGDSFSTLYVGGPATPGAGGPTTVRITVVGEVAGSADPDPSVAGDSRNAPVVPWMGGNRATGHTSIRSLVTPAYDAGTNATSLRVLDSASAADFAQVAAGGPLQPFLNNALAGSPADIAADTRVNTLVVNTAATVAGSARLTVGGGVIANAAATTFGSASTTGPEIAFGATRGFFYHGDNYTFAHGSRLTGTSGVAVSALSASHTLAFNNTANANTFSGGLFVNGNAQVDFNSTDTQLGLPGEKIALRGGALNYTGAGAVVLSTSGSNRPVEVGMSAGTDGYAAGASGGGLGAAAGATLTVPGAVTGQGFLVKRGLGTVVLTNAANSYAGGTFLDAGALAITSNAALGAAGTTLTLNANSTVAGNGLRFDADAITVDRPIVLQDSTPIDTNGRTGSTLSGVISGSGPTLSKFSAGTLTLTGANTFTAAIVVNGGELRFSGGGAAPAAGALTVVGAAVTLDNAATAVANRINNASGVALQNGGTLALIGNAGQNVDEYTGTLSLTGLNNSVDVTATGNRVAQLILAGYTPASGEVRFRGTNLGSTAAGVSVGRIRVASLTSNQFLAGAAAVNLTTGATDLAYYDTAIGVRPANPDSDYVNGPALANPANGGTVQPTDSFRVNPAVANPVATAGNANTVHSLRFAPGGVLNAASGTLTLTSGVLTVEAGAASTVTGSTGGITAGSSNLRVTTHGGLSLDATINGTGGFTKQGAGTLTLQQAINNIFTGTVTLREGVLSASGSGLNAGSLHVPTGAALAFNGGTADVPLRFANATTRTVATFGTAGTHAGGFVLSDQLTGTNRTDFSVAANTAVTLSGPITGGPAAPTATALRFTGNADDSGTFVLTNSANSFNGTVSLFEGTLAITSNAVLGPNANVLDLGTNSQAVGGLRIDGADIDIQRAVNFSFPSRINTNGHSGTISGSITGAAPWIKAGAGTLRLSGNNTLSGTVTVGGGILLADNVAGTSASGTGAVVVASGGTLAGGNGGSSTAPFGDSTRGFLGGNVTIQNGGTLSPGNSVGVLSTTGNITFADGAALTIELGSTNARPGGGAADNNTNDRFKAGGNITFGTSLSITVNGGGGAGFAAGQTYDYFIGQAGGTLGALPGSVTFTPTNFGGLASPADFSLSANGVNLVLTFQPVPEPATVLGVFLGGLAAAGWYRRRARTGEHPG